MPNRLVPRAVGRSLAWGNHRSPTQIGPSTRGANQRARGSYPPGWSRHPNSNSCRTRWRRMEATVVLWRRSGHR
eukprot:5800562-Amphidinium_carterae.1